MNLDNAIIALVVVFFVITIAAIFNKEIYSFLKKKLRNSSGNELGESSRIRLIHHISEAVQELSKTQTGAIITITRSQILDDYHTDGFFVDANISSQLLLSIFNKKSPLHDGAVIIENGKLKYVATYFRITEKVVKSDFGARHRAAMGISEKTDALTIVVSETSGRITIFKGTNSSKVHSNEFQEKLTHYLSKKV